MAGHGSDAMQRQRKTPLRSIAGPHTPIETPTQARQVPTEVFPVRSDSLVAAATMTDEPGQAFEQQTNPTDYSDGANFQVTDHRAQETAIAKESDSGKFKTPADHLHETCRAPPAKENNKGILKSKNKNREISEALSNFHSDDEADRSKEDRGMNVMKDRSNRGTPEYSERSPTPDSSNPRLVRLFPTQPLSPRLLSSL